MQGAGTALGELPPYFMARAARLSGQMDEEEEEIEELLEESRYKKLVSLESAASSSRSVVLLTFARLLLPEFGSKGEGFCPQSSSSCRFLRYSALCLSK